jgi:predicted Zn-ribbon and HTH transcriptional regulator
VTTFCASNHRKPSTAGEITELLNRDLELKDLPFHLKDIAECLRETDDTVLVTGSSAKVTLPGDTGHAVLRRFEAA